MPPKPVLEIDMAEFRTMQKLMIKAQDKAKEIRHLQDTVLPKLKRQLADTKGIFKGKERKALTEQIQRTEKEIAEKLDKLPDCSERGRLSRCAGVHGNLPQGGGCCGAVQP